MDSYETCEKCDHTMYSTPCLFCMGRCGAMTSKGIGCRFKGDKCPVAAHKAYRGFSNKELREWYRTGVLKRRTTFKDIKARPKPKSETPWRGAFGWKKWPDGPPPDVTEVVI